MEVQHINFDQFYQNVNVLRLPANNMALIIFILHVQEAAARFTKAPKSAGITTTKKDRNAQTIAHATQVRHVVLQPQKKDRNAQTIAHATQVGQVLLLQPPKEGRKCTDHCACHTVKTSFITTNTKDRNAQTIAHATQVKQVLIQPPRRTEMHRPLRMPRG